MTFHALVAGHNQLITVTDSKSRANNLQGLMSSELPSENIRVEEVTEMYPEGYVDASEALTDVYEAIRHLA